MSTERRVARRRQTRRCVAVAALVVCVAGPALAHNLQPKPVRELVRVQGYRAPAPQGVDVVRETTLIVLGQQLRFAASDWRVFIYADAPPAEAIPEPDQVTLQGDRALLHPITSARPDQQITILGERRPGSHDLFVLTVDVCPSR